MLSTLQSNAERTTTKSQSFQRASAFTLHSAVCCSADFPPLTPALSVVKLILIELWSERGTNRVARPLSNPLWSARRGSVNCCIRREMTWRVACCHCSPNYPPKPQCSNWYIPSRQHVLELQKLVLIKRENSDRLTSSRPFFQFRAIDHFYNSVDFPKVTPTPFFQGLFVVWIFFHKILSNFIAVNIKY